MTHLITRCLDGERKAQKELYEMYAPKMYLTCFRYAKNKMEAEDILQDAFIKIFTNLSQFREDGCFEGWVRRIVSTTILTHIDKKSRSPTGEMEDEDCLSIAPVYLYKLNELNATIEALPTGYKTVIKMYSSGYHHQEIADVLGVTISTSKSQFVRGRKKLLENITK